ncbi:cation diffusion facilitator family transporter [Trichococcus collinsii]|uniref:Cobalt-zinc-cadmium efflux system protein n=1 Tax=Trichococcus collinsii TaxID=157076 RepID=A0AB38A255_9LACT|nr:cation diffusion facilitator family transporter [Trichococcus collinsii]CZR05661.1 cation efflux protein [Trichococcus collinsii]SEA74655.1 cobalt-zinc-cadmium efflux system protein [Trichococcus collinsii]
MTEHTHAPSHPDGMDGVKGKNLLITIALKLLLTIAEVLGGWFSGSLSLLSDALHNLNDVLSIVISWFAVKMAEKKHDKKNTFGYRRATIIAAVINATLLIIMSLFLFREAYFKFIQPEKINALLVIVIAAIGIVLNAVAVYLLHKSSGDDLNMRAVYLHFLSDALSSVGVIVGGVVIYYFDAYWIDPLLTVLIGIYILKESYEILKESANILMQGTPKTVDIDEIAEELEKMDAIKDIHHVHIWALDENTVFFEAHVNLQNDILVSELSGIYEKLEQVLKVRFGVTHLTIQFEYNCCDDAGRVIDKE